MTEGLLYGQLPFKRSDVTEKSFCHVLRLPGTAAAFLVNPPVYADFRERQATGGQSPDLRSRPLSQGGLLVAATSLPPLSKGGGTAAGRDGGIVLQLTTV